MVSALNLSRYIVHKCTEDKHPVSNLQLQKMLYFIQSVYFKKRGQLLFAETFEAWPYGPVVSEVYIEFSSYGGRVIERTFPPEERVLDLSQEDIDFIDEGIEVLRSRYPWDLVRISHAPSSPWAKIYRDGEGYKAEIPNSLITEFATRG